MTTRHFRALLLSAVFAMGASAASAQTPNPNIDSDADGIDDSIDVAPCDASVSARAYLPPGQVYGVAMFEDSWPSQGDFDFNDAVIGFHQVLELDSSARMTGLVLDIDVMAVGARFDNGLAFHVPAARSLVTQTLLTVDGQQATSPTVTPWSTEGETVVTLADSLHGLFGVNGEWVNTDPNLTARPYVHIRLEMKFAPASISIADALFDLFLFNTQRGTEVHLPGYAGTSQLDSSLVGTKDDDPNRHFTTRNGIPFALAFLEEVSYPAEGVPLDALYPEIVAFGQSNGTSFKTFYQNPVISARYTDQYQLTNLVAAFESDLSCFTADPGICGPAQGSVHVSAPGAQTLCQVGAASPVSDLGLGADYAWQCQGVYSTPTDCVAPHRLCMPNTTRSCTPGTGANGVEQCDGAGTAWSTCQLTSCQSGYYQSGSTCIPVICSPGQTRSCSISNGSGVETCNNTGTAYNTCTVASCNSGYTPSGNACAASNQGSSLVVGNTSVTTTRNGITARCLQWSGNYCLSATLSYGGHTMNNACVNQIRSAEVFCWVATGSSTVQARTSGTCGQGLYFGSSRDGCGRGFLQSTPTADLEIGSTTRCGGSDGVWCGGW